MKNVVLSYDGKYLGFFSGTEPTKLYSNLNMDILDKVEDERNFKELGFAYALYAYDREGLIETLLELNSNAEDEIKRNSNVDMETQFNLMASTLSPEQECRLKLFLIRRIKKGTIYAGTGNISGMDFRLTDNSNTPAVCYYILLPSGTEESLHYIICLATTEPNLDVFRPELTSYCNTLVTLIANDKKREAGSAVLAELEMWPSTCLQYVCRVVRALGLDVSALLQLAQQSGSVEREAGVSAGLVKDVEMFLSACKVEGCLAPHPGVTPTAVLQHSDTPGHATLVGITCSAYCVEWGKALLHHGPDAKPWRIRKAIEAFKLKTIKDVNVLNRLLKQSETDHYSLYRAYSFLWQSGNSDVLLSHVKTEGSSTSDLVNVLEEHLVRLANKGLDSTSLQPIGSEM